MELTSDCPKCKGQMEQGFIVDHTPAPEQKKVSEWAPGPHKPNAWSVHPEVKNAIKVTTYRCTQCGYLESYAK